MVKAKVIGAGGYGGVGISELLMGHPGATLTALVDVENVGLPISRLYPHLIGSLDMVILDPSEAHTAGPVDVVFTATPDGVGMKLAQGAVDDGATLIDFSGDFRFTDSNAYGEYATRMGRNPQHDAPDLLAQAVYGLPELYRDKITVETRIVGNPGCFAVSCILGLAPAVKQGLVETDGIICDCKTGVSGAGKKAHALFHYPARYDNMNAYKLSGHQHVCEIEHQISTLAGKDVAVTFTAQVVPACRGIMSSLYARLNQPMKEAALVDAYRDFYAASPFVRVLPGTELVGTADVRGSNYANLVVSMDARTSTVRVISYIDNLMKGQAGSAVQNMNLAFGLPETLGLERPGMYP